MVCGGWGSGLSPWRCGSECGSRPLCHAQLHASVWWMFREGRPRARAADATLSGSKAWPSRSLHPSKIRPLFSFSRAPHLPTYQKDACSEPDAPSVDAVLGTGAQRGSSRGPVCRKLTQYVDAGDAVPRVRRWGWWSVWVWTHGRRAAHVRRPGRAAPRG